MYRWIEQLRKMEHYVICPRCTGLLSAADQCFVTEHVESCEGKIDVSPANYFAVDKDTIIKLLGRELTMEGSVVEASKNQILGVEKTPKKRKRKKKAIEDDIVLLNIKKECETDDATGQIRRSKRMRKPKKNDDFHDWNDGTKHPQQPESLEVLSQVERPNGELYSNGIEDTVEQLEPVDTYVSEQIEAILMEHPDPEVEKPAQEEEANALDSDSEPKEDLAKIKKEPDVKKLKSEKMKYVDWKSQLVCENVQYKVTVEKEAGKSEEIYRCPKCEKREFPMRHVGLFARHLKTCKPCGSDDLRCLEPGCDHVAKDAKRFSEHKRYHLQPYMCEFCSRRFADKRNMREHRMTHTDERPLACDVCEYRTRNKRLLKEHKRKHTGAYEKCPESGCDFVTLYHGSLRAHIEHRHRQRTKYQCEQCPYVTNSKPNFSKHQLNHSGTAKHFQCSLCPYKAVSKFAVVCHLRSHTKEKLYFCDKCNYSASYTSAFKLHMMTHLGLKTWQCSLCGYNSNTRAKVTRHIQSKHAEANPAKSVINLGVSLKLDWPMYQRKGATRDVKPVVINAVVPTEEVEMVENEVGGGDHGTEIVVDEGGSEQQVMVEVGGEEIVISQELLNQGQELILLTESGQQLVIPQEHFQNFQQHHNNNNQTEQTEQVDLVVDEHGYMGQTEAHYVIAQELHSQETVRTESHIVIPEGRIQTQEHIDSEEVTVH